MTPFRNIRHLAARFFGVLLSDPLGPSAQDDVNTILAQQLASLFWDQDPIDQRHAYDVAMRVRHFLGNDDAALEAALLHDIGKRHSDLGAIARSLATIGDNLHLPLPDRWRRYRDHGPLGASDLVASGASPLTVAFARGEVGPGIDQDVWDALREADNV